MAPVETERAFPTPPSSVASLGIPDMVVEDILLQRLVFDGRSSVSMLASSCALSVGIVDGVVDTMRQRLLLEIQGMDGRDYILVPTDKGKLEADNRARTMAYTGAVPVSISDYTAVVRSQQGRSAVRPDILTEAFDDLVIADDFLDQLGPALASDGAVFLYGPPGTGKTSLAERMVKMYSDPILIPRAVEADRQLVTVFDPALHEPVVPQPEGLDPRWVLCARPCIIVGGELNNDHLELKRDPSTGISRGPIQMLSNNGILVVDDFGRQRISPEEILNRWIVPMSRGIDFVSLSGGTNFTNPFDVKLVFSTNMRPDQLGDEAFLRRIPNKVFVGSIDGHAFDRILAAVCRGKGVSCDQEAANYMKHVIIDMGGELRPYYPIDFANTLASICTYEGVPLTFTPESIDKVSAIYFTRDGDGQTWDTAAQLVA